MTKDQAVKQAQADANKSHRTMLVLNMNPFASNMFVVREFHPKLIDSRDCVAVCEPDGWK